MSPFKSTRWIKYTQYYVNLHRYKYVHGPHLNNQDWEDITQEILAHIWIKHKKYKVTMPLKPWIKTIVQRQIVNRLRSRCVICPHANYSQKALIYFPRPLISIIKEDDIYGEVKKEYIRDVIYDAENSSPNTSLETLQEIISAEDFRRIKDLFIDFNIKMSAKRLKIKPVTLYCTLNKVKRLVKNAKNNPVAF